LITKVFIFKMPTVERILQLAPVCCYLSANNVAKKTGLFGGVVDEKNPINIYNVYKILKHVYDKDPTYDGLQVRCDYLYELCKQYAMRAAAIVDGGGGGSVAPVTPTAGPLPSPIDFIVSASSFIPTGGSSVNIPTFIGYNLNLSRGGITQYTTDPGDGSSFYTWNSTTGDFSCSPAASAGEQFRFYL